MHGGRVVFPGSCGIFRGCGGLFVGFCKSSTEDPRAGEDDLSQYPVRLRSAKRQGGGRG